jgi:hypothetical protein
MLKFAQNWESSIRNVITLYAVIAAFAFIPRLFDFEEFLLNNVEPGNLFVALYIAGVVVTMTLCAAAGYYFGKIVTWPLRNYVDKHERLKHERMMARLQGK